jgi:hypothetical protein
MDAETHIPASEPTEDDKSSRLTEAQWAEIIRFYELGKKRMVELSEEYGVSRQALSKRFKRDGVVFGSKTEEVAEAVTAGVKAAVETAAGAAVAASLERYADQRMAWIEETRLNGYKGLKQADMLAKKIVSDALKAGKPISAVDDDLKAVHRFQKILAENALTRLDVLDANKVINEEDIPDIIFEDLTDDDIIEHHKKNNLIPEDASTEEILAELNIYEGLE